MIIGIGKISSNGRMRWVSRNDKSVACDLFTPAVLYVLLTDIVVKVHKFLADTPKIISAKWKHKMVPTAKKV